MVGRRAGRLVRFLLIVGLGWAATGRAAGPLHRRIDEAIEAPLGGVVAAPATDAEFLRRVWLDLAGMIPTADEARAFLDDPSPYKRERLIDQLLAGPEYARRMQDVFDVMLMERRGDAQVPSADWREFLRRAFRANRPYDQLVRDILAADGLDPAARPASRFLLEREAEPYVITRDIGRMFLGRDMQCAQCHDHPIVDDYKQEHYYGLFAYLSRTVTFADPRLGMVLGEKAEGDVEYRSVFKKKVAHKTTPHLLDIPPATEPTAPKGGEYLMAPSATVRPVPVFSRRERLAPDLTSGALPDFDRNIVNRLWALMFGRGLVQPLDLHHGDNPPSHPELLADLASAFREMGYDVRAFLRELALSRAYQRSSEPPPGMSEELLGPKRFAVAALEPLGPEQLGWSVMQAVGMVAAHRLEVTKRLDVTDTKLRDILRLDAKRQRLREELIERGIAERLGPSLGPFIQRFGGAPGQPQDATDPTVHQALFLTNGEPVQGWLKPSGANLTARLAALGDPNARAEELYLSILSRRPTAEERAEVAAYLASRTADVSAALQELCWSLLASTEFRFNH